MAFLGDRNRKFAWQQEFLSRLATTMHVDLGLAESLRLLLEEFAQEFHTEEAFLAYRDTDLERIFIWRLKSGESERLVPENLPADPRRRFPSRRHGSLRLLEFRLRAAAQASAGTAAMASALKICSAHARPHAAGARHQEFHVAWPSIRMARPPGDSSWSIAGPDASPFTQR